MAYTTIDKPTDYFNTILYSGNRADGGGGSDDITGVGFSPNWVWIKCRNTTKAHYFFDTVRGVNTQLNSNNQNDENVSNSLTHFLSDGFTLSDEPEVNETGNTFVAWNWFTGASAVSNTEGNVTTSVSANTTAGLSVLTYSGNGGALTIGHGLGAKPAMIFIKNRTDDGSDWIIGHKDLDSNGGGFDNNKFLKFSNSTTFTNSAVFGTEPSTTSIALATVDASNISSSGKNFVAWCFSEVKGYCKIGKYKGNGSSDGTTIFTGFRPAFILYKNTDTADNWFIHDNRRQGFNDQNELLFADITQAESTVDRIRILSNGFKTLDSDKGVNKSGDTYVYMAFAEFPFVSSTGIPTCAF